jgi:hypothetical protein
MRYFLTIWGKVDAITKHDCVAEASLCNHPIGIDSGGNGFNMQFSYG